MGLNYIGFAWCYMEQEFVGVSGDLDALKALVAEKVREIDSTPHVAKAVGEITQFASGRPWRVITGDESWSDWREVTPNAVTVTG